MLSRALFVSAYADVAACVIGRGEGDDGHLPCWVVAQLESADGLVGQAAFAKVIGLPRGLMALDYVGAGFFLQLQDLFLRARWSGLPVLRSKLREVAALGVEFFFRNHDAPAWEACALRTMFQVFTVGEKTLARKANRQATVSHVPQKRRSAMESC